MAFKGYIEITGWLCDILTGHGLWTEQKYPWWQINSHHEALFFSWKRICNEPKLVFICFKLYQTSLQTIIPINLFWQPLTWFFYFQISGVIVLEQTWLESSRILFVICLLWRMTAPSPTIAWKEKSFAKKTYRSSILWSVLKGYFYASPHSFESGDVWLNSSTG